MTCRAWAHAALFLIVAGARSASAADAGPTKVAFLFSTGNPDCTVEPCSAPYQTFLIVIENGKMRVAVRTPHLYTPRKDGFWEVGIAVPVSALPAHSKGELEPPDLKPPEFTWQLWAAPIGVKPVLPKPPESPDKAETSTQQTDEQTDQNSEVDNDLRSIKVTWLGTNYVSVERQIGEYNDSHDILSLDGIAKNDDSTPWTPKISNAILERDMKNCVDENSDFNTSAFLTGAGQTWSIARTRLGWSFDWFFGYTGGAARGYATSCASSARPPSELVGGDVLGVGWNQILSHVPDAKTAFASPEHSVVLVFTATQVLALPRDGTGVGAPLARVFISTGNILSNQWAFGKYADHWSELLSHASPWKRTLATSHCSTGIRKRRDYIEHSLAIAQRRRLNVDVGLSKKKRAEVVTYRGFNQLHSVSARTARTESKLQRW
jgi:hypothetical protein